MAFPTARRRRVVTGRARVPWQLAKDSRRSTGELICQPRYWTSAQFGRTRAAENRVGLTLPRTTRTTNPSRQTSQCPRQIQLGQSITVSAFYLSHCPLSWWNLFLMTLCFFPSIFSDSNVSFSDTSITKDSSLDMDSLTLNSTTTSEKSFIQQRVERLYGPGALAQGFFFKRSSNTKLNSSDSFNKSNNNNNDIIITDNANTEESLKNLPVLRHLRPEFRAQLPVVSPRRPTDGSEQIIKPLQR